MVILRSALCLRNSCRLLSTESSLKAVVGKKIGDEDELERLFLLVSWKTSDLMIYDKSTKVGRKMVEGLLSLSGLETAISAKAKSTLQQSLAEQLQFVNKLHSVDIPQEEESQLKMTRLIDDTSKANILKFDGLQKEMNTIRPLSSKGEIENSWNPLSLAKEHDEEYFVVKEGLIKKNKTKMD